MVWIGLISYPLYLWHWPLLVFFAIIKFDPLTLLERELICRRAYCWPGLTYQYVEKPFRFGRPSPAQAICAVRSHSSDRGWLAALLFWAAVSISACRPKSARWRTCPRNLGNGGFTDACLILAVKCRSPTIASIVVGGPLSSSGAIRRLPR